MRSKVPIPRRPTARPARRSAQEELPRRRLELPVIAGLIAVAMLVIGAYVVQDRGASERAADARALSMSARQATMTQRIAVVATRLSTGPAVRPRRFRAELRSTAQAMRWEYEVLTRRPETLGASGVPASVQALLEDRRVERRIRAFTAAAERVAAAPRPRLTDPAVRRLLANARGPLRRDLDRVTLQYEREAIRSADRLNWALFVGTGLIVIGLIMLGALVFLPLARRIREEIAMVALLEEIAVTANATSSINDAYTACLALVCEHFGWPLARAYLPEPDGAARGADVWFMADRTTYGPFAEATKRIVLAPGVGLPGRVIVSGEPAWAIDIRREPGFPAGASAAETGLVGALAFPVRVGDEVVGVVEAYAPRRIDVTPGLLRILSQVGVQLGHVIERERSRRDFAHRALHDALTGLPNRTLLLERIVAAQRRSAHTGDKLAVVLLDLDNFKLANDALGHEAGDRVLIAVGERLASGMRTMDIIARLGGDEFVVLCEGLRDEREADGLAGRVQFLLKQQVSVDGRWMSVGASMGIAIGSGAEKPEDLLRDADTAMSAAKRRARGSFARFDASMREEISERLRLTDELVGVAHRGELRLFLQPIVDLERNRLRAFEALVRWEHPVHGLLSPTVFIPLAEDSGVVGEIGAWVLRESVRWASMIHPGVYLSVNLSIRQLEDPTIVETVRTALQEFDVPAGRLTLEVTESVLLDGADDQLRRLEALRGLGCRISLDDFGTGYSSLSYLQDLPLDVLKLDRAFAMRLIEGDDRHASTIIHTVATLARGLELDFVVEGVETAEQLGRLRRLGCTLGQGYLFARPMAANEAVAYAGVGRAEGSTALRQVGTAGAQRRAA